MAQLLRVKRKIGESSVHALAPVKRSRLCSGSEQSEGPGAAAQAAPQTPVFQYIGTVPSSDRCLPQHVLNTVSRAAKRHRKPTPGGCTVAATAAGARLAARSRDQHVDSGRGQEQLDERARVRSLRRYHVVNTRRQTTSSSAPCSGPSSLLPAGVTLFDAAETARSPLPESVAADPAVPECAGAITCNGQSLSPAEFVYDLYLCTEPVEWSDQLELTVYGDDPPLWHPPDSDDEEAAASSDSNAEDHWRADYPDEDEEEAASGDDSSDYLHAIDSDDALQTDLVRRLNECCQVAGVSSEESDGDNSVIRSRDGYDRFKRRVLRQMEECSDADDEDLELSF